MGGFYFKMTFCDDVGYIDFYAENFSLIVDEANKYKVEGSDCIPIRSRLDLLDKV